jgi:hypothetical protein
MKLIEAIKEIPENILILTALIAIIRDHINFEAAIQNQPQKSCLRAIHNNETQGGILPSRQDQCMKVL